jgi:Cu2+-containing amine oxidase
VTLVANGGLGLAKIDDTTMPPLDQQNWMDAGKSVGFRLTIERIEIAEPVGKSTWIDFNVISFLRKTNYPYLFFSTNRY